MIRRTAPQPKGNRRPVTSNGRKFFPGAGATAFLTVSLMLGGSAVGTVWPLLLVWSLGFLLFALARFRWGGGLSFDPTLSGLVLLAICLPLVQLLPLMPSWSADLSGRHLIGPGSTLLGTNDAWAPASLTPLETIGSFSILLPVVALMIMLGREKSIPVKVLFGAVVAFAALSALAGLAQVGGGKDSPLYFHAYTNWGMAVGFFANANHLASFLLMALPLIAALLVDAKPRSLGGGLQLLALPAFAILAFIGIWLTQSAAGLLLLVPVLAASALIPIKRGRPVLIGTGVLAALAGGLLLVAQTRSLTALLPTSVQEGGMDRISLARTTVDAIRVFLPNGSGAGSFQHIYPLFEDPDEVTNVFANHTHNDWLEIILEYGIGGGVLALSFFFWWGWRSVQAWRRTGPGVEWGRAASIAVAVTLLHSMVDYPARTPAIFLLLALCVLILSQNAKLIGVASSHPGQP